MHSGPVQSTQEPDGGRERRARARRTLRKRAPVLSLLAAGSLVLAACGGGSGGSPSASPSSSTGGAASSTSAGPSPSSSSAGGTKSQGGTVTWAESSTGHPNFIFPLTGGNTNTVANSTMVNLMYRPLVWAGDNGQAKPNPTRSLFKSMKYSNGDKTVTITLKDWKWSNGNPITTRDIQFFFNLIKANKGQWSQYSTGLFPDNIKSLTVKDAHTFVLQLTQAYNPNYFTDDQLGTIIPLPQKTWDKTSATGKVGNYDMTTAGAKAVWKFLYHEGGQISTFSSNPLWQVVDGPWKLQSFDVNGAATLVPNRNFSGPVKPTISKFEMKPFTSDTAEFNVLRSGNLDVGYLPLNDLKQLSALKSLGYKTASSYPLHIDFIVPNLTSIQVGSMLSQLYIRQAMQELIPQKLIVQKAYNGYAQPGAGPVPVKPPSPYVSSLEKSGGPYTYSTSKAEATLKAHGWKVTPGGTDTCTKPGTGSGQCGKGIKQGAKLDFKLLYASGSPTAKLEFEAIKSSMAQAGITLDLKGQPFNTVIAQASGPCKPSQPSSHNCRWQLVDWGGWTFGMDPVGVLLFSAGSSNTGGYANPKADQLIRAALHSSNPNATVAYENYIAKQLPDLWTPGGAGITVYKAKLHGVTPLDPFGIPDPNAWYFTK
ncbi:MAG: peptide ABC transporter substrate-binding protein [Acidimicrobiales bacterium]